MRKIGLILSLFVILLFSSSLVAAACTYPPVRNCNGECNYLFPNIDAQNACIYACIDDDQADRAAYYDCQEAESEQAAADQAAANEAAQQAAAEQAAADAEEQAAQDADDAAEREFEEQMAKEAAAAQAELDEAQEAEELAQEEEAAKAGTVDYTSGKVEIRQADGSYKPLSEGESFKAGDIIRTGNDGMTTLTFDDSDVNLGPNSVFLVEELDSSKKSFKLSTGRIWAYVQKLYNKQFTVRTPTAVHAVRGTEFIVEYDEDTDTSTLYLYEGEVELTANGKTTNVMAGETVVTSSEGSETYALSESEDDWYNLIEASIFTPEEEDLEIIDDQDVETLSEETGEISEATNSDSQGVGPLASIFNWLKGLFASD